MDKEYLKKVREGDKEAFRYFVEKYSSKSYSLALSMVKNETEAEEIVQLSFIKAWKAIPGFREEAKFSSWLFRIVVNECQQYFRNKKKANAHEEIQDLAETESSQEDKLVSKEEKIGVKRALSSLKPKEALVVRLFYIFDMNLEEIGEVTGFGKSNIKVLLFRGRKNLKKRLQEMVVNEKI